MRGFASSPSRSPKAGRSGRPGTGFLHPLRGREQRAKAPPNSGADPRCSIPTDQGGFLASPRSQGALRARSRGVALDPSAGLTVVEIMRGREEAGRSAAASAASPGEKPAIVRPPKRRSRPGGARHHWTLVVRDIFLGDEAYLRRRGVAGHGMARRKMRRGEPAPVAWCSSAAGPAGPPAAGRRETCGSAYRGAGEKRRGPALELRASARGVRRGRASAWRAPRRGHHARAARAQVLRSPIRA